MTPELQSLGQPFFWDFPRRGGCRIGLQEGLPTLPLSSLDPLNGSKKDLREWGSCKVAHGGAGALGCLAAIRPQGFPVGRAFGAKKASFPSLRNFSEMEAMGERWTLF